MGSDIQLAVILLGLTAAFFAARLGHYWLHRRGVNLPPLVWLTNFFEPATIGAIGTGIWGLLTLLGALNVRGSDKHEVFQDPIWNLWAERVFASTEVPSVSPAFAPTILEPNHDYSLMINVAGLRFSDEQGKTVFSKEASSTFAQWLDRNPAGAVDLSVIALVDTDYFVLRDSHVKPFRINLSKIRQAKHDGFDVPGSPFEYLRSHNGEAPFSFGLQSFRIRTKARTGSASIAVSIWADGKPVDELTLTLCIVGSDGGSSACQGTLSASNPLTGVDLTMRGIYPDMALHLLDRDSGVVGVLRCNSCGWPENKYLEWELMETADWVSSRMNEITADVGRTMKPQLADVRQIMERAGTEIYNVIFHSRDQDNDASRAFPEFVAKAQAREKDGRSPPSLFARIIPKLKNLRLAPVGMMRVILSDGTAEFVGFVANVQTPLEYQDYSPSSDCISRWVLFVPPENPPPNVSRENFQAVLAARRAFKDWIGAFKKNCADCVIDNETEFQKWLSQSGPRESQAVVILSHHSANALYFSEAESAPRVLSSSVSRRFASPSFVILDACGTSEPGASEFLREFNFRGVNSAIATSTEVDPVLAGKFLATFMSLLQQHANETDYTVDQARFDAVRDLGRAPDSIYGANALAFILAGNGALRICTPR